MNLIFKCLINLTFVAVMSLALVLYETCYIKQTITLYCDSQAHIVNRSSLLIAALVL